LQRLESFDGVAILTTNLPGQIDEAFLRRIRFNIPFEKPDHELRLRLWRGLLPEEVPTARDIDLEKLASYEMSGGLIKNAIVQAAFLAADLGRPVDQGLLTVAATLELRNQGHAVRGLDLMDYLRELEQRPHTRE
jgi:SpoVK/Ycf46/Vps4 family AAA+-type ATPase